MCFFHFTLLENTYTLYGLTFQSWNDPPDRLKLFVYVFPQSGAMAPQQGNKDSVPSSTLRAKCHPSRIPYEVVIVVAAFCICTIYAGTMSISGLYFKYFMNTFEAGKVTITGVISVQVSVAYLSGECADQSFSPYLFIKHCIESIDNWSIRTQLNIIWTWLYIIQTQLNT